MNAIQTPANESELKYDWGEITLQDQRIISVNVEDWELFSSILKDGEIIEQNSLFGMKYNGQEAIPCLFDQIERLKHTHFARWDNFYWELSYNGGGTLRGNYNDKLGFFVENGKKGWRENGEIIIPAQYDYVEHYEDSNFYEVEENDERFYMDVNLNRVLTYVRPMESGIYKTPFPLHSHDENIIVLQEYVGQEVPEDKNVVLMDGVWQRLDLISRKELANLFINPDDECALTEQDLENLNDKFSYEYSAYSVVSNDADGVKSCLRKLQEMKLHSNTWYYVIKVWRTPGEHPSAEELRYLRYEIENNGLIGQLHFAVGHDPKLAKGETKMLAVTHFNDRCPAWFEFDWNDSLNSSVTLEELQKVRKSIARKITKYVKPEFRSTISREVWNGSIASMRYVKKRKWKETKRIFQWLSRYDKSFINGVPSLVEDYIDTGWFDFKGTVGICEFWLRKLKWMLKNGANVNRRYRGKTALDIILRGMARGIKTEKEEKIMARLQQKCIDLLMQYGAKTIAQIREEESSNTDYKVELIRMK